MKMRISFTVLVAMALVLPMGLSAVARQLPSAELVYFENNSRQLKVTDDKGAPATAKEGMKLGVGWTVKTGKGDIAEVELTHNKTIIKISQNTTFTVKALGDTKANPNVLAVAAGKIRTVAGKATGNERYRVEGGAAVCGVSGTDFIFTVPEDGSDALLQTLEGLVEFWKASDPGNILQVGAKMAASIQQFVISQIPDDVWNGLPEDNKFQKLDPKTVPGSQAGKAFEEIVAKAMKILGVEIGSITMYDPLSGENVTWAKVVAQPNFKIGPVKAGLYLPLIYNGNMFDPGDWYHPNGNDEWSFGFDQTGVVDVVVDVVSDTFLKIKYFEWNEQRDPFFFKIGNLNDITIGHGLIMRDFANDADFPAVRRVGLNLGLDFGKVGFEYMVNDAGNLLTLPVIFSDPAFVPDVLTGGRIYFQPFDNGEKRESKSLRDLAFGVSLLADLGPAVDFYDGGITPEDAGKPIFLNPGVDLDVPIFETDFFSIVGFADAALMLPYLRSAPDTILTGGSTVSKGFAFDAVWNPDADVKFKNYGLAAGMFGNIWFIDWRLEYRYYTGVFKPAFYNTGYERSRSEYVSEVLAYLGDTANPAYDTLTMGVYGEGGFNWKEIAQLDIGYFWPWDASGTIPFADMEDRLILKLTFQEIPVIKISGAFSYERTGFAQSLIGGGGAELFDANTVVKAELAYPLVEDLLDVVLFYTTTAQLGTDGKPVYSGGWLPEMSTNLTIETRVSY
jgi:hypothetical protein